MSLVPSFLYFTIFSLAKKNWWGEGQRWNKLKCLCLYSLTLYIFNDVWNACLLFICHCFFFIQIFLTHRSWVMRQSPDSPFFPFQISTGRGETCRSNLWSDKHAGHTILCRSTHNFFFSMPPVVVITLSSVFIFYAHIMRGNFVEMGLCLILSGDNWKLVSHALLLFQGCQDTQFRSLNMVNKLEECK